MAWANGLVMNWVDWRGGRQFGRKEEMRRTVGLRFCSICLMLFARWVVGEGRRLVLLQEKRNHKGQLGEKLSRDGGSLPFTSTQ